MQEIDGFKEAQLLLKGSFKNGGMETNHAGFEYDNDKIKSKSWISLEKEPKFDVECAWRMCNGATLAAHKEGSLTDLMGPVQSGVAFAGSFKDTGVQYGMNWASRVTKFKFDNNVYDFYFNHKAGNNTVGATINYNQDAKKFSTVLGLQMKHDDHTWKFRFHESGMMRAALQWQLHKTVKSTLNTSVNMRDIPSGSIGKIPLNLTLEVKY
jgi:hypothetical protein